MCMLREGIGSSLALRENKPIDRLLYGVDKRLRARSGLRSRPTTLDVGLARAPLLDPLTVALPSVGRGASESRGTCIPPSVVVAEVSGPGLTHTRTIDNWPPGDKARTYFLVLLRKP